MPLTRKIAAMALATAALAPAIATGAAKRVHDGLYAPKANNKTPYSNGAVDITVFSGGRKIKALGSGVACYTGATPPAGVPVNTEVTIHLPHSLTIGAGKTFSFSGPVTLTPQDAQTDHAIQTTFTLRGHFVQAKHGTYTAKGTDSSPICQPSTPTRFTSPFAPGAS